MASMEVLAAVATAKEEDLKRATEEPSEATPSPEVKCEVDAVQDSIARKKISHSAIERRRRQRINEKISQLQRLLPDCADREGLQMAFVLQKAIEHIDRITNENQTLRVDRAYLLQSSVMGFPNTTTTAQAPQTTYISASQPHNMMPSQQLRMQNVPQMQMQMPMTTMHNMAPQMATVNHLGQVTSMGGMAPMQMHPVVMSVGMQGPQMSQPQMAQTQMGQMSPDYQYLQAYQQPRNQMMPAMVTAPMPVATRR